MVATCPENIPLQKWRYHGTVLESDGYTMVLWKIGYHGTKKNTTYYGIYMVFWYFKEYHGACPKTTVEPYFL